jgi:NAD(P)-dependent dehydrogenase (short-subunit alcohol dehydrogenase family)
MTSQGIDFGYGAAKAGVCPGLRRARPSLARYGIRLNAALPGPTETRMTVGVLRVDGGWSMSAYPDLEPFVGRRSSEDEVQRLATTQLSVLRDRLINRPGRGPERGARMRRGAPRAPRCA